MQPDILKFRECLSAEYTADVPQKTLGVMLIPEHMSELSDGRKAVLKSCKMFINYPKRAVNFYYFSDIIYSNSLAVFFNTVSIKKLHEKEKTMKKKAIVLLYFALAAVLLLSACGGGDDPVKNPKFTAVSENDPPAIGSYQIPEGYPLISREKLTEGFYKLKAASSADTTYKTVVEEFFGAEGALCKDASTYNYLERGEDAAVFVWFSEYASVYIQFNYSKENKVWYYVMWFAFGVS